MQVYDLFFVEIKKITDTKSMQFIRILLQSKAGYNIIPTHSLGLLIGNLVDSQ